MSRLRPILAMLAMAAAAIACLVRGAGWWACDVACQGGGWYRDLLGVPTVWPAAAAYALMGLLSLRAARSGAWPSAAVPLAWALAGASAFFLWIAWRIGLACPFCFTVHGLVGVTVLLAWPWPRDLHRILPPACALFAFLALNLTFHHDVVADVAILPPVAAPAATAAAIADPAAARLEAVRCQGSATAPLLVTMVIEMHCPVCARLHPRLVAAFAPALASGRVQVATRFLSRRRQPSGHELAAHVLAAGLERPELGRSVLAALLGVREGTGFSAASPLLDGVADPAAIAAIYTAHAAAIEDLLSADARWLAARGVQKVPTVLIEDRDGTRLGRWDGELDPAAVAAAAGR